jgi:hypothetical protein
VRVTWVSDLIDWMVRSWWDSSSYYHKHGEVLGGNFNGVISTLYNNKTMGNHAARPIAARVLPIWS